MSTGISHLIHLLGCEADARIRATNEGIGGDGNPLNSAVFRLDRNHSAIDTDNFADDRAWPLRRNGSNVRERRMLSDGLGKVVWAVIFEKITTSPGL